MGRSAWFKKAAWMVMVVFLSAATVQAYSGAQIIPRGQVNVYRDGALVETLRDTAPLPDGALLKPEGLCGVRLQNLYLVAEDGSAFAVSAAPSQVELSVGQGTVYFAANPSSEAVVFETPAGTVAVQQFLIQTSGDGTLKGFVDVAEGTTTIGVLEGGSMVVSTATGEQRITAGNQITLAQATGVGDAAAPAAGASEAPAQPTKIPTEYMIGGAIGVAALAVGAIALGGSSSSDTSPPPVSPSAP